MDLGFDRHGRAAAHQLGTGLGLDKLLPATLMFDYPTIDALAAHLLVAWRPPNGRPHPPPRPLPPRRPPHGAAAVAAMSDAELEALLARLTRPNDERRKPPGPQSWRIRPVAKRASRAGARSRARAEAAAREPIATSAWLPQFGGGNDADSFWRLMRDGVDAIGPLPADRWDTEALYDPDPRRPVASPRAGGFLGAIDGFDAGFSECAARAQGMDPQQRLLLEVSQRP